MGDTEATACMWRTIPKSMFYLFLAGTLLDNITDVASGILGLEGSVGPSMTVVFFLYVLVSSFTILNMLIGVLCEVVSGVANDEQEKAMIMETKQQSDDEQVSHEEFNKMLENKEVCEALEKI